MRIPRKDLEKFAREIADQCLSTRQERIGRGNFFENYMTVGSSDPGVPAMFNKVYSSLDDLQSLLFSPVSLKFKISDPDIPSILNGAKGRAAASRIRNMCRQSESDSTISEAVKSALVKGLGLTKQVMRGKDLSVHLIQPENFGVLREDHDRLDKNMEAFTQSMFLSLPQFDRLVRGRPDEAELRGKARRTAKKTAGGLVDTRGSAMNIVVGGVQPFQPGGTGVTPFRGVVDWMSQPRPSLAPAVEQSLLEMHEVWVWDDERDDWATFQLIGDVLALGRYQIVNAMAYNADTMQSDPVLRGSHPYNTFCVNPVPGYFWGMSEIARLVLLQEAINSRLTGINKLLRRQEDPATKFIGSTGVNQQALSRFNKPGGYWTDNNPNAKVERDTPTIPPDLWASLREYERMFDEIMGLPPIAKGQGDAGVRSDSHAETLIRMFSPRFKDRALLVERDVERFGSLTLDLARAHDDRRLIAWVPEGAAGMEAVTPKEEIAALSPPAPGLAPVFFTLADLPEEVTLKVDSHSSSPAFSHEARALSVELVKMGAMSPAEFVEHTDTPDEEELIAGIQRREIAKAKAVEQEQMLKFAEKLAKKR